MTLREMAEVVVAAEEDGDPRALVLYLRVAEQTCETFEPMKPGEVRTRLHMITFGIDVYA